MKKESFMITIIEVFPWFIGFKIEVTIFVPILSGTNLP